MDTIFGTLLDSLIWRNEAGHVKESLASATTADLSAFDCACACAPPRKSDHARQEARASACAGARQFGSVEGEIWRVCVWACAAAVEHVCAVPAAFDAKQLSMLLSMSSQCRPPCPTFFRSDQMAVQTFLPHSQSTVIYD